MIRAVGVDFLNARPLWESLRDSELNDRLQLSLALPSELARAVAENEADVGLLPVAAAATIGDLRLLRNMAIGARGKVRSVALVADRPIHELDRVALDLSSRTSVVLARLLLARRKLTPKFFGARPVDALPQVGGTTGAVIIGDPALDVEHKYPYRLDLAEDWFEWTGLPFVFAAWFARPDAVSREDEDLFRVAKQKGLARTDAIAAEHAARSGLDTASLRSYLTETIRYDLGDEEMTGLERFWLEASKAGLLPKATPTFEAPSPRTRPSLDSILTRAADGERLSLAEGVRLIKEGSMFELGLAADAVRKRKHPDGVVTYIVDRNVNYTNVCTTSCRFCAFYRPVGHPEGYVLSREVLGKKLQEVVDAGGVQILLQGGLNPELRIEWYEDLFRWMKSTYGLGLHALSPEEIIHLATLENLTYRQVLERLHAAGLDSVPGGGAEILVDRVRRKIAKQKCTSAEWLEVMRVAHHMGLRSSATMMYGTVDTAEDRIQHLIKIRDLQDETGGFTAFFCWDFQYENGTHIAPGENGTHLYLRQQAVARLMLDNVDHVGASWVTQGPAVGQVALRFGADDFGSVMFEENVVSSAGTTFRIGAEAIENRIHEAGFKATRRNVRYDWLTEPLEMSATGIVHADWLLTGDGAPIQDGALVHDDDGGIVEVGRASEILPRHQGLLTRRVRGVVFPGLINAHTHVELSNLRGKISGGRGFVQWVDTLVATRTESTPEDEAEAVDLAMTDLARYATVGVGEVTNSLAAVAALARSGLAGCVFHEVLGLDQAVVMKRIAGLKEELTARVPTWPTPDLSYAPSPHTLYTLHPDAARNLLDAALEKGVRVSVHLAEHPSERRAVEQGDGPIPDWFAARFKQTPTFPKRPLFDLAEEVGALRPGVVLVHLTEAKTDELERVARSGASVVFCPRSNLYIEGKLPPLLAARAAGIDVALGTDSLASNASLDVLAEAKALADRFPSVPADDLIAMATWNGARALGRMDLGRISKGARPGIFAVDGEIAEHPARWLLSHVSAERRKIVGRSPMSNDAKAPASAAPTTERNS